MRAFWGIKNHFSLTISLLTNFPYAPKCPVMPHGYPQCLNYDFFDLFD